MVYAKLLDVTHLGILYDFLCLYIFCFLKLLRKTYTAPFKACFGLILVMIPWSISDREILSIQYRRPISYILLFVAYILNAICNRSVTYAFMLEIFLDALFQCIVFLATQWALRHP